MSKKILFAASTLSHIRNFHLPYLQYFKEQGYEVHAAGKTDGKTVPYAEQVIDLPFQKSMFAFSNLKLAFQIAGIIRKENYDIVSMHTSLAAFFLRLGILVSRSKPPLIINTVHGYLFDDRTPPLKRSVLLLAEKMVRSVTDRILVMNRDDLSIAQKHKLCKSNQIFLIDGMGVDFSRFQPADQTERQSLRSELGFTERDLILVYVAEFSVRKNQQFLIRSMAKLKSEGLVDVKLLLPGNGSLLEDAKNLCRQDGLDDCIFFPGFVSDTWKYYQLSDICVSCSRSEGLPFNIMEAMSVGLPTIASKVKGHTDLVDSGKTGFLFEYDSEHEFCDAVKKLYHDRSLCKSMGQNAAKAVQKYSLEHVFPKVVALIDPK